MKQSLMNTRRLSFIAGIILVGILLGGLIIYIEQGRIAPNTHTAPLSVPITHKPVFQGNYPFILGSGNVMQNGSAYSYVWINASALEEGDSFVAFPALNVGLKGNGLDENNFAVNITYTGSEYGAYPYWINFSIYIPVLNARLYSSYIEGNFSRSSGSLPGFEGALFFSQISNVVGDSSEFEFFFYIGNSSTPLPQLTHGPVH
ncbi:MAG: hypothetical protein JRN52_11155 [Nitrososphaerota archaeon]|nr:hypothetical protein [Nitrososphaerota archaeon]